VIKLEKTIILTVHYDASHGWIEIHNSLIKESKIKFSSCSYKNGSLCFLEEDSDAPKMINYLTENGYTIKYAEKDNGDRSGIREYNRM